MSILSNLLGAGLNPILKTGAEIVDEFVTTKEELRAADLAEYKAETERIKLTSRERLAQISVNREEAKSSSLFIAGWRPCVGWVCALSLAWNYMFIDIAIWAFTIYSPETQLPALPETNDLITLLLAMLGFGGIRTGEKMLGVAREQIKKAKP